MALDVTDDASIAAAAKSAAERFGRLDALVNNAGIALDRNAVDPGYTATDLNSHRGTRTPAEGAAIAIRLACCLDETGPTGSFFDETGRVAW